MVSEKKFQRMIDFALAKGKRREEERARKKLEASKKSGFDEDGTRCEHRECDNEATQTKQDSRVGWPVNVCDKHADIYSFI